MALSGSFFLAWITRNCWGYSFGSEVSYFWECSKKRCTTPSTLQLITQDSRSQAPINLQKPSQHSRYKIVAKFNAHPIRDLLRSGSFFRLLKIWEYQTVSQSLFSISTPVRKFTEISDTIGEMSHLTPKLKKVFLRWKTAALVNLWLQWGAPYFVISELENRTK